MPTLSPTHSPAETIAPSPKLEIHAAAMRRVQDRKSPSLESALESEISERAEPNRIARVLAKFFSSERQLVKAQADARAKLEVATMALKMEQQLAVKLLNRRASLTEAAKTTAQAAGIARSKVNSLKVRLAKATDAVERRVARGDFINHNILLIEAGDATTYAFALQLVVAQADAADKAAAEASAQLASFLEQHAEDLACVEMGASSE